MLTINVDSATFPSQLPVDLSKCWQGNNTLCTSQWLAYSRYQNGRGKINLFDYYINMNVKSQLVWNQFLVSSVLVCPYTLKLSSVTFGSPFYQPPPVGVYRGSFLWPCLSVTAWVYGVCDAFQNLLSHSKHHSKSLRHLSNYKNLTFGQHDILTAI